MSIINFPTPGQVPNRLKCSECGVEVDAGCSCDVAYVPAIERAKAAVEASPEKSNRAIAAEIGADEKTVRKARKSTADRSAVGGKRTGRDGKVRKLPIKKADKAEIDVKKPIEETDDPAVSGEEMKAKHAAAEVSSDQEVGAYLEALGLERFILALHYAPKFKAEIERQKNRAGWAKTLTAVADPHRNLSPVQIGKYLNLLGPDLFIQSLNHAPEWWAAIEQRVAEEKLRTSTLSQATLIQENGNGAAIGLNETRP
jgi:hypothetical protein